MAVDRGGDLGVHLAGGALLGPEARVFVDRGVGRRRRPYGRAPSAERCALFVIIALGEAIVVNGATFAELDWTADNLSAFVSALVGAIAMWWIYFHKGAEAGSERISKSAESGRLARLAYTYLHMPIVAGIILTAVSDELVLKHPTGHSDTRTIVSTIGGPLVFLVGTILFKHAIRGFLQLSHGVGIILLLALSWFAADLSPLRLSVATTTILIVVAVWESVSLGATPEEAAEH